MTGRIMVVRLKGQGTLCHNCSICLSLCSFSKSVVYFGLFFPLLDYVLFFATSVGNLE